MMKRRIGITAVLFFTFIPLTFILPLSLNGQGNPSSKERGRGEGKLTQPSHGGSRIQSSDRRDPFIPLIPEELLEDTKRPEFSGSEITLQAILITQNQRGVIINNLFLRESDIIPNTEVKIVRIEKERVIINYRLNDYQLRIGNFFPLIKSPSIPLLQRGKEGD